MNKNINAGALRHRVALIRDSQTATDLTGQPYTARGQVGSYYALVECLGGSEDENAKQLKGVLFWRVTIRASAGPIRPKDIFQWDGRTLNVVEAMPDPNGILIECRAKEIVNPQ